MDQIENNVAEQTAVETDTTQTSPPQVKEETTLPQTTEGEATQQGASSEPKFQTEEERKAFQDMRLENKRLKEEIEARTSNESAFKAFKPQGVSYNAQQFVDPITGEVNYQAQNQAQLQQAKFEAAQAARDEIDEFQARQKYPDIFADRETEELVASQWFASKMRGEEVTITQVADRLAKRLGKVVSKAEKSGAEKALQEVTPKEQAALAASGQNTAQARADVRVSDWNEIVHATRRGDEDAIAARIAGIPYVNK